MTRQGRRARMFITHHREKLINAIIFFLKKTRHCHTLKLFKLLYFLDFEHFRQTGKSVTGLRYVAWPMGPAPDDLWHELDSPHRDLAAAISVARPSTGKPTFDFKEQAERDSWDTRDRTPNLGSAYSYRLDGTWSGPQRREIKPRQNFDSKYFTKRELKIMEWLAEVFKDTLANDMTEVSHSKDMPWGKIFAGGKGKGQEIPYELSLDSAVLISGDESLSREEYEHRKQAFQEIEEHSS